MYWDKYYMVYRYVGILYLSCVSVGALAMGVYVCVCVCVFISVHGWQVVYAPYTWQSNSHHFQTKHNKRKWPEPTL